MSPKYTKKYKTIERSPLMRIPRKISAVHTIRTSITYSKLQQSNSPFIYHTNTVFQVKIIRNFKTSHNLLDHFILYIGTDTSL